MNKRNWTAAFRKAFAASAAMMGVTATLALYATSAHAQDAPPAPPQGSNAQGQASPPPGMRRPGMGGPMIGLPHSAQLVNRPDVSKDLGLTQDQRDQIKTIMQSARTKMQSLMPPPPGEGQEGGERPDPEAMRAKMDKAQAEIDQSLAKVFTASQIQRLKEIKIQIAGSSAVLDKEIQDEIGLTSDQKSQINALVKAQQAKMGRQMGGPGGQGGPGGPGGQGGPGGDGGFGGPPPGGPGGQGGPGQDGGVGGPPGRDQGGFGGPGAQGGPGGQGGPGFGGPGGPGGPGGQRGPGGGMNPQMEKARKEMNTAIDAILTSDQKAALKKLAGTKVFVQERRQGGPGGQGGPGFGGPGGQGGPGGPGGPGGQGGPGGGDR